MTRSPDEDFIGNLQHSLHHTEQAPFHITNDVLSKDILVTMRKLFSQKTLSVMWQYITLTCCSCFYIDHYKINYNVLHVGL